MTLHTQRKNNASFQDIDPSIIIIIIIIIIIKIKIKIYTRKGQPEFLHKLAEDFDYIS